MKKKHQIIIFLLILVTGLILRTYRLGVHDLWFDEILSIYMAKIPAEIPLDSQPSLYYLLLHFWMKLISINEFNLRLLSVIFGIFSIIMIYQVGKLLFDYRVALTGAFILSISPINIWYAQELKGYTLFPFLIVVIFYFFVSAIKYNKKHLWIGFVLFSSLSVHTNYISLFMFVPEGLVFLLNRRYRTRFRTWMLSSMIILVSFLPWVVIFLKQASRLKHHFWIPRPNLVSIMITLENFNVGYTATKSIYVFSSFLFLSLFAYGLFRCWREKETMITTSLLSFFLAPIVLILFISQWLAIYIDRQLICFSVFYYIIISVGIMGVENRIIKSSIFIIIIFLASFSLSNYYSDYLPSDFNHHVGTYIKKPFKPMVKYIKENIREGDIIVHSNASTIAPFWYYYDKMSMNKQHNFAIDLSKKYMQGDPYWQEVAKVVIKEGGDKAVQNIIVINQKQNMLTEGDFEKVWLISSSWSRKGHLDLNSSLVREWMLKHFSKLSAKEFDGILVETYQR